MRVPCLGGGEGGRGAWSWGGRDFCNSAPGDVPPLLPPPDPMDPPVSCVLLPSSSLYKLYVAITELLIRCDPYGVEEFANATSLLSAGRWRDCDRSTLPPE